MVGAYIRELKETDNPDILKHFQELRNKISKLEKKNNQQCAEVKDMRVRLNKANIDHQEREKELLREITLSNRRNKNLRRRLDSKIQSNRHLKERLL